VSAWVRRPSAGASILAAMWTTWMTWITWTMWMMLRTLRNDLMIYEMYALTNEKTFCNGTLSLILCAHNFRCRFSITYQLPTPQVPIQHLQRVKHVRKVLEVQQIRTPGSPGSPRSPGSPVYDAPTFYECVVDCLRPALTRFSHASSLVILFLVSSLFIYSSCVVLCLFPKDSTQPCLHST
jgi:hypothetical protein